MDSLPFNRYITRVVLAAPFALATLIGAVLAQDCRVSQQPSVVRIGGLRPPMEEEEVFLRRIIAFANDDMKAGCRDAAGRASGEPHVRLVAMATLSVATINPHRMYQVIAKVRWPLDSGEQAWFLIHAKCLCSVLSRDAATDKWHYCGQIDSPIQYFKDEPTEDDIGQFIRRSTFGANYGGTTYRLIEVISYTKAPSLVSQLRKRDDFWETYQPTVDPQSTIID